MEALPMELGYQCQRQDRGSHTNWWLMALPLAAKPTARVNVVLHFYSSATYLENVANLALHFLCSKDKHFNDLSCFHFLSPLCFTFSDLQVACLKMSSVHPMSSASTVSPPSCTHTSFYHIQDTWKVLSSLSKIKSLVQSHRHKDSLETTNC